MDCICGRLEDIGAKPLKKTTAVAAPPGFESIEATYINDAVDIQ